MMEEVAKRAHQSNGPQSHTDKETSREYVDPHRDDARQNPDINNEESGFTIHDLYHHVLQRLSQVVKTLTCQSCITSGLRASLEKSLGLLYMWAQGIDLHFLQFQVSKETDLQALTVRELADIAAIAQQFLPESNDDIDSKARAVNIATLKRQYDMPIRALLDESDRDSTDIDSSEDDDPDQAGNAQESLRPHQSHVNLCRYLATHTKCLMAILPTIVHQCDDLRWDGPEHEQPAAARNIEVSETIKPYVMQIQDKFTSIDDLLACRLAEANWNRFNRLQKLREGVDVQRVQDTRAATLVSASEFRDSGLGASLPAVSKYASSNVSHSSLLSTQSALDRGAPRVPTTPPEVAQGLSFTCSICTRTVDNIRTRAGWKFHVFTDIQPYVCTFSGCSRGQATFQDRQAWVAHEATHRFVPKLQCVRCQSIIQHKSLMAYHTGICRNQHNPDSAAKSSDQRSGGFVMTRVEVEESCPMCPKKGLRTMSKWSAHVGRHLEEVALIVLPRSTESDDGEENSNDERDERSGSAQSQHSHHEPHLSTERSDVLESVLRDSGGHHEAQRSTDRSDIRESVQQDSEGDGLLDQPAAPPDHYLHRLRASVKLKSENYGGDFISSTNGTTPPGMDSEPTATYPPVAQRNDTGRHQIQDSATTTQPDSSTFTGVCREIERWRRITETTPDGSPIKPGEEFATNEGVTRVRGSSPRRFRPSQSSNRGWHEHRALISELESKGASTTTIVRALAAHGFYPSQAEVDHHIVTWYMSDEDTGTLSDFPTAAPHSQGVFELQPNDGGPHPTTVEDPAAVDSDASDLYPTGLSSGSGSRRRQSLAAAVIGTAAASAVGKMKGDKRDEESQEPEIEQQDSGFDYELYQQGLDAYDELIQADLELADEERRDAETDEQIWRAEEYQYSDEPATDEEEEDEADDDDRERGSDYGTDDYRSEDDF